MQKISRVYSVVDLVKRAKKWRVIVGMMYYLLSNNGCFTEQEADKIIDACLICRESSDPDHHPLQTSVVSKKKYKRKGGGSQNGLVFSDVVLRRALSKRGFYLNIGPFSEAESLTLMRNFEKFLARNSRPTDRDSIWNILSGDFHTFYKRTQMFLFIGKNLNRTSRQIHNRLFTLYQPYAI